MNALNILTLDTANQTLQTQPILPAGPAIKVAPIQNNGRDAVPSELQDVFVAAVRTGQKVTLVTCRRAGVPERADGSHLQHFLVPASSTVRAVGMTI